MSWTVKRVGPVCTDIRVEFSRRNDWEQWFLLTSDVHSDNPKCKEALFRYHMNQCKDRGGIWMDFGDFIDGMQGKGDKRSAKGDLIDDVKQTAYLNALKKHGVNRLGSYLECLAIMNKGNHESGLLKHYEYDVTDEIVESLQAKGSQVISGTYRGWIRLKFAQKNGMGGGNHSYNIYFHHGHGGGGPVTKGTLNPSRKAAYLREADIVLGGHIHENWIFPIEQIGVDKFGKEYSRTQMHIQLPTYKEEFLDEGNGFHHEKGGPPKPLGGMWLKFYYSIRHNAVKYTVMKTDE